MKFAHIYPHTHTHALINLIAIRFMGGWVVVVVGARPMGASTIPI